MLTAEKLSYTHMYKMCMGTIILSYTWVIQSLEFNMCIHVYNGYLYILGYTLVLHFKLVMETKLL